jgi:hypothetical protein
LTSNISKSNACTASVCSTPKKNQLYENANKGNKNIKRVGGQMNPNDLYATIGDTAETKQPEKGACQDTQPKDQAQDLPPGWEKLEDTYSEVFFKHTKTGVTQREVPEWQKETKAPVTAANPSHHKVPKSPVLNSTDPSDM